MWIAIVVVSAVALFVVGCLLYVFMTDLGTPEIIEQSKVGTVSQHTQEPQHVHFQKDGKAIRCSKCVRHAQYEEEGVYTCKKHRNQQ